MSCCPDQQPRSNGKRSAFCHVSFHPLRVLTQESDVDNLIHNTHALLHENREDTLLLMRLRNCERLPNSTGRSISERYMKLPMRSDFAGQKDGVMLDT
jgi:hypothetical protein